MRLESKCDDVAMDLEEGQFRRPYRSRIWVFHGMRQDLVKNYRSPSMYCSEFSRHY